MLLLFKVEHSQSGVRNPLTIYKFARFMDKILLGRVLLSHEYAIAFSFPLSLVTNSYSES